METQTNEVSTPADLALKLNDTFAKRVIRWKRLRLGAAIVLCGTGISLTFFDSVAVFAVPLLIGAFIAYVLYLDSRDQANEVKSRKWGTVTPRISRFTGIHRKHAAGDSRK